jgi:hypothetical protein
LRLAVLLGALGLISGCYYKNPYDQQGEVSASGVAILERGFLADSLAADGMAHVPADHFAYGSPLYLTVFVSGKGAVVVTAILRETEAGHDLRAVRVLLPEAPVTASRDIGAALGDLAPGAYYLSIVLNGVPSWGLSFEILPIAK